MHLQTTLPVERFIRSEVLPTKETIATVAQQVVEKVREDGNVLETITCIDAIGDICKKVREGLEADVLDSLQHHPKGIALILGAKIEAAEVGVKYDYSGCPKWAELKAQSDSIAAQIKQREALLKTLSKPMVETDSDSGDTIEVLPPSKTSKSSFKITLGK